MSGQLVPLQEREMQVGAYTVRWRDWRHRELRGLDEAQLEDYFMGEIIQGVDHSEYGEQDPQDLPESDLIAIINAVSQGVSPNGSSGSRQRQPTHR